MASVNFLKIKDRSYLRGLLKHCDSERRPDARHSNKHIDTSLTWRNWQTDTYETSYAWFKSRMDYLDSLPGANKRRDRVECFCLEIPVPAALAGDYDKSSSWLCAVDEMLTDRYGAENDVGGYMHGDEVHEYDDARTGEKCTSRLHLHKFIIPAIGDKLCGKDFSSKKAMQQLNKDIDKMTREKYGCRFLTGEQPQGGIDYGKRVEDLKVESEIVQAIIDEDTGELTRRRRRVLADARKDAAEIRRQAEQDARDAKQAAAAARAERDKARSECVLLQQARKTLQDALQGDLRAADVRYARQGASDLLAALGASVRPCMAPAPGAFRDVRGAVNQAMEVPLDTSKPSTSAWAKVQAAVAAMDARNAERAAPEDVWLPGGRRF